MTASTQEHRPTSVAQWKKSSAEPVELPSGNFIRVRRMSMSTLLATGKLPNSLVNIVKSAVDKGQGMDGVEDKMSEILADDKQLEEMAKFMDDLICMVAVEPRVHFVPKNEDDRRDDLLYADEIDEADKSFVFQLVTGGTSSLEQFREATAASVAAVSGRQDLELPAERAPEVEG